MSQSPGRFASWDATPPGRVDPHPIPLTYQQPVAAHRAGNAGVPTTAAPSRPDQVLARFGRVEFTADTLHTPAGSLPLSRARLDWHTKMHTQRHTPQWTIISAIVGFFVIGPFSLLFLLAGGKTTTLFARVAITAENGFSYQEHLEVRNAHEMGELRARIDYANNLWRAAWNRGQGRYPHHPTSR